MRTYYPIDFSPMKVSDDFIWSFSSLRSIFDIGSSGLFFSSGETGFGKLLILLDFGLWSER